MFKMKLKTPVLIITLFLLSSCSTHNSAQLDKLKYRYITIDGMTCISYNSSPSSNYSVGRLTCNWQQWNGKKDLAISE